MTDVVVESRRRGGPSAVRAAWYWAMSSGVLVRRSRILGYALLVLEWPLYAITAVAMREHLVGVEGAAIIVRPRRGAVRVPPAVVLPVFAAAAVWVGLCVGVTVLVTTVSPTWLWALPVVAVVVGVDVAGDAVRHPVDFAVHGSRSGVETDVRLSQLAAYPRGTGAGGRAMRAVCERLDTHGWSAALVARRALHAWYREYGFRPVSDRSIVLHRPTREGDAT